MSSDSTPRSIHLLSGLIVLCTFVAGAGAGAGLYAWGGRHGHGMPPGPPPHGAPPYLHELQLSADQERAAQALFEKHRVAVEDIMHESFPRVRAANETMERALRALLTPEQAKKLDEIEARRPPDHGFGLGGPPRSP